MHGNDWVGAWLHCMVTLSIDPHSGNSSCLMPAPGDDGRPLKRAIESDEAGCWLRLLLGEAAKRSDSVKKLSSHSLKSTMLSFAAKRGYSRPDRLAMGHHVHPYKMVDVYARDAQARGLRLLDALISEIRSKTFMPDESRAGRFSAPKKQKVTDASRGVDADESFSLVGELGAEAEAFENDDKPAGDHVSDEDSIAESTSQLTAQSRTASRNVKMTDWSCLVASILQRHPRAMHLSGTVARRCCTIWSMAR